jgi:shikimate kinase
MPAHPPVARVYLTGFMGAGKTTVGRILARRLDWQLYDVDSLIETEQQASVAKLFMLYGEQAFRAMEHAAIRGIHQREHAVISIGGGALETTEVRQLIHDAADSHVVFLDAPLPMLIDRCLAQEVESAGVRPLLQDRRRLEARYKLRLAYYRNAHLTVATQSFTPEEVAATVLDYLAALDDATLSPKAADGGRRSD